LPLISNRRKQYVDTLRMVTPSQGEESARSGAEYDERDGLDLLEKLVYLKIGALASAKALALIKYIETIAPRSFCVGFA